MNLGRVGIWTYQLNYQPAAKVRDGAIVKSCGWASRTGDRNGRLRTAAESAPDVDDDLSQPFAEQSLGGSLVQ